MRDIRYLHVAWLLLPMKLLSLRESGMLCDASLSSVKGASCCRCRHQVKPDLDLPWCCCRRVWEMALAPICTLLSPPQQSLIRSVPFCAEIGSQRTIPPGGGFSLIVLIPKHSGWGPHLGSRHYVILIFLPTPHGWDIVIGPNFGLFGWIISPNAPLSSSSCKLRGPILGCVLMSSLYLDKFINVSADNRTYKERELRAGIVEWGRWKWNQVRLGTGVVPSSRRKAWMEVTVFLVG